MNFVRYAIVVLLVFTAFMTMPVIGHYMQGNLTYSELPSKEKADAVMVFSGAPERLEEGYKLYLNGLGQKLMITGNDYGDFAKMPMVKKVIAKVKKQKDKIFIDLTAENTVENARMGADWAIKNNVKSIILITTEFHMQRSFFELRRLLPDDVEIFVHAVPGQYQSASMDTEQIRLICRVYETAIDADFCYQARELFLGEEDDRSRS